ncbi:hypothetical protein LTR08_004636 [Meristemomyces frigidus]|nr:hypothetical protein LTR08_004636 [Meristemomyces frigidus]
MATRIRQSTERGTPRPRQSLDTPASRAGRSQPGRQSSSAATPAPARSTNQQLPPYEPPVFTLNPAAQRALAALAQASSLRKLDKSLKDAQAAVSNAATEINDRLTFTERETALLTKKRKRTQPEEEGAEEDEPGDSQDAGQAEKNLDLLRERVDKMTNRMDESMRKLIDGQHSVGFIKDSLATTAEEARANASTQASTQNLRTQRSQRRTRRVGAGSGSDEDVEEEEYPDFQPTDPTAGTQPTQSTIATFRTKLDNAKTRYQSHTLHDRYAENNDYREFRQVVYDARNPGDNAPPMPHARDWFPEGDVPAPGITARPQEGADDDDDDIAIERSNISTKCPLTLQEFKNPLSSKKCQHSFEKVAIMEMIGQRGSVQCPVPGCGNTLTKADLHTDAVLLRKIKRIQRAKELEEEEADEKDNEVGGGNGHGRSQRKATLLSDDDEEDVDTVVDKQKTQMKNEPPPTGRSAVGGAERRPPQSSQLIELGGSSDDEDEE